MLNFDLLVPSSRRRAPSVAVLILSVLAVSCDGDRVSGPLGSSPGDPSRLSASTPQSLTGTVATAVTPTPAVVVRDAHGRAVPGVRVEFSAVAGSGTVDSAAVTTDAEGVASVGEWVLGTRASDGPRGEPHHLMASAPGLQAVFFTAIARAGEPASILAALAGDTLFGSRTYRFAVTVLDRFGNPVADVPVSFRVAGGDGEVLQPSVTTNALGALANWWRLGAAGPQTLHVEGRGVTTSINVTALDPAAFTFYEWIPTASAQSGGVLSSFLALSTNGLFVIETAYWTGLADRFVGRYRVAERTVQLTYGPSAAPKTIDGTIDGDEVVLMMLECDVWYYDCWAAPWRYRAQSPSGAGQ